MQHNRMKKLSLLVLIDFATYAIIFLLSSLFGSLILNRIASLDIPESVFQVAQEKLGETAALLESSFYYFVFLIIIFFVVSTILWTISRAIVWRLAINKKITVKYLLKSTKLLLWIVPGIFLGVFLMVRIRPNVNLVITILFSLLFIYQSNLVFLNFAKHEKFSLGKFKKKTVMVFAMIAISAYILFKTAIFITSPFGIILVLIYLLFLTYSRYYFIAAEKKG